MILLYLANAVGAQPNASNAKFLCAVIRSEDGRRRSAIAKQEANAQFRQGWKLERAQAAGRRNQDPIQLQPNDRAAPGAESAVPHTAEPEETQSQRLASFSLAGPCRLSEKMRAGGGRTRTDSDSPPHSPTHRSNRTGGRQVHTAGLRIMPRCSERSSVATRSVTPPPCSLASGAAASR